MAGCTRGTHTHSILFSVILFSVCSKAMQETAMEVSLYKTLWQQLPHKVWTKKSFSYLRVKVVIRITLSTHWAEVPYTENETQ